MKHRHKKTRAKRTELKKQPENTLQTLSDHLTELRNRLMWIAAFFLLGTSLAYPFFHQIEGWLLKPIGSEKLYYTTPAGGISFIIKVCMYVGFVFVLPAVIYHVYQFVAPVMAKHRARSIAGYTIASFILALAGIGFAYFISLPAALHFLTNIQLDGIHALISIDAYMAFITAYLVAGALLFQILLVMLIIDSITPLPPRKLMGYQRYNIVASFVIAALITPTPDVVNQAMIAGPMIAMYQLAVIIIWFRHRRARKGQVIERDEPIFRAVFRASPTVAPSRTSAHSILEAIDDTDEDIPSPISQPTLSAAITQTPQVTVVPRAVVARPVLDIQRPTVRPTVPAQRAVVESTVPEVRQASRSNPRSIDGFFAPAV